MEQEFKLVNIYIDDQQTLIMVPNNISKYGLFELSTYVTLEYPYSSELLFELLMRVIDRCTYDDKMKRDGISAIEQYSNIKGYGKAVKGKKLVVLEWIADEGFWLIPTKKIKGQGFIHIQDNKKLLNQLNVPELAQIFTNVVNNSETY